MTVFDRFFGRGSVHFGDMLAEYSEIVQFGVALAPLAVVDVEGSK